MEQFNTIPTSGNWSDIAGILDANFFRCYTALVQSESLVGLSGSNFQGIYTSASALPDEMSSSGWALVGSSLSALTLYVYNTSSSEWGALNNVTYNFTDFSEFQNQLDALSSQLTQIGLNLDNLSEIKANKSELRKISDVIRVDDDAETFYFADKDGNVIAKIDANGLSVISAKIKDSNGVLADILSLLNSKVNVEEGKGLSTNDYTTEDKSKVDSLADDKSGYFYFADKDGNVIFKIGADGVHAGSYNICNSSGDIISTITSNTLAKLASLYDDKSGGFAFTDIYGNVVFKIDADGNLDFCGLTEHARNVIEGESKEIVCWGDSLTQGQGSTNTAIDSIVFAKLLELGYDLSSVESGVTNRWVTDLQMMLDIDGKNYRLINQGVGGESMSEIAARQGSTMVVINKEIVIPSTAGTEVQISDSTNMLTAQWDTRQYIRWTNQGSNMARYNPIYIQGIPCNLRINKNSGSHPTDMYISRVENGNRDVTIPSGTAFFCQGSKNYSQCDISIFWCYANGGFVASDPSDLVSKMKMMVEHTNGRYLIIGYHNIISPDKTEYEAALEAQFGDRFFNWRKYVCSNALEDFGVTPSADDLTYMAAGSLPPSFWRSRVGDAGGGTANDHVHMNASAYAILAYKIKERLEQTGLI